MGSAENGGGQHLAPEGHQIGTPPPWDVYDTFPKCEQPRCCYLCLGLHDYPGGKASIVLYPLHENNDRQAGEYFTGEGNILYPFSLLFMACIPVLFGFLIPCPARLQLQILQGVECN